MFWGGGDWGAAVAARWGFAVVVLRRAHDQWRGLQLLVLAACFGINELVLGQDLGFARVDLFGQGAEERLSVRLFDAAPWPWLTPFRRSTLRAHYEVDRRGRVSQGL